MSAEVFAAVDDHFKLGNFDDAADALRSALSSGFEPNLAMSLFGVCLHRDTPAEAAPIVEQLYQAAPQLQNAGLRELVTAYDLYTRRRSDPQAAQQRQSISGPPAPWQMARLAATVHHARGEHAIARQKLAEGAAPPVSGSYTTVRNAEVRFSSLDDMDALRGPMLVCLHGPRVVDVPFAALRSLVMQPPKTFFGSAAPEADLTLRQGGQIRVRVPMRYPGSGRHQLPDVRLGRTTMFDRAAGYTIGWGMVDFKTDAGIVGLGSIASITFD